MRRNTARSYLGEIAKHLETLAISADKMERTLETILSLEPFADVKFRNEVVGSTRYSTGLHS
jgi:hypothetical protein